jgi:hypothetical protein
MPEICVAMPCSALAAEWNELDPGPDHSQLEIVSPMAIV